ncbi:MAG: hypothetical protein ACFFC7_24365 [Candidatus Hermodarchaeota archaeon]
MKIKLNLYYKTLLFGLIVLYLLNSPLVIGSSFSELEQRQIPFVVNEIFDLSSTHMLTYQFPLWLDWVGTHARIRVQGGIIDGRVPTSLGINVLLDGVESNQIFVQKDNLRNYYTFHSTSEYLLWVQPPAHPAIQGIKTLHNFTIELSFIFSSTPKGTGIIKQIIFETLTPLSLNVFESTSIIPLQDQFSWQVTSWSFGTLFFNTSLVIPLLSSQNVTLTANIEFDGLDPDGWRIIVQQGEKQIDIRDQQALEGNLELDPSLPCELIIILDPPRVSETKTLSVSFQIQGTILAPQGDPSTSSTSSLLSEKSLIESLMLLQVGMVVIPFLLYYRTRHNQKHALRR